MRLMLAPCRTLGTRLSFLVARGLHRNAPAASWLTVYSSWNCQLFFTSWIVSAISFAGVST